MKKNELVEMIRKVVSEEIKKQLPKVVSEMFIRGLIKEHMSSHPLMEEENFDDYVPGPLHNEDEGIYQDDDMIKSESSSIVNRLLSNDNPMRALYEGVDPSTVRRQAAPASNVKLNNLQLDFSKMNRLMDKLDSKQPGTLRQTPDAEARRLAQLRAELDKK